MPQHRDRTAWLHGGEAVCLQPPPVVRRTWRLVLLGPPGVGKGTQGELLCNSLGACPLSTGDVFRAAKGHPAAPGSAMARAQAAMQNGELVSDDTVLAMVRERDHCLLCRGGFMLDGFPRTLAQATALDAHLETVQVRLDAVISYELPLDQIVTRISGRLVCPKCKAVFHATTHPPRRPGICDQCGAALTQRPDDRPEAVRVRLEAYESATQPLAAYYDRQNLLVRIMADGAPMDILAHTLDALVARGLIS